uniref:GTP cyclohydrolase FolE2 n=1 Tax=Microbulbifer agarilyticus TaxID=260552 RepID=UPI000255B62A|nr:GTP cyclohydrolase FolE2 [Microbulbifer agarilyticus]
MQLPESLPDIAKTQIENSNNALRWVGMEDIAIPLLMETADARPQAVSAKANVYVSLDDPSVKGIHMSRLHALLNRLSTVTCDRKALNTVLKEMVESQAGISKSAKISLSFDLTLPKGSLLSDESGYQSYPIEISGESLNGEISYGLKIAVPYSSTCPCSAALARQLYANALDAAFPTDTVDKQALLRWALANTVATPHSQRSYAYLALTIGDNPWPPLASLVQQTEETIGTPVQTMVKRRDEQEFARLNGDNLMFCEDAARRIKGMLENADWVKDYWFKVEHQESLHAHNAVVIDQKYPS